MKLSLSDSSVLKNVFRPHENDEPAFSNSSGLGAFSESFVFLKDYLVTVDCRPNETVEIKLRFQIFYRVL